ncbi:hypothetical protein FisN_22Lh108 [Fistulifera solaris]|uniref:DUF6824 domain-containing protein n=1 Tax=Fistulifera solaris TaxID=1519565 RepID=A0A1Z5JBP3_FISSO|nr:hypothetical protein FisN_22Lh108 [Fistulifera solaris]|eukprot:GAX11423.1 hypothetical protein FisN_22Lh108 [Fistulifera solaris]
MASGHPSPKGSRPVKVIISRDQSILAKRHLPRQLRGDSNFILVGNRNKKGKFVLLSRPKIKLTHVLSKSSLTTSPSREATDTASSNTETAATTLHSASDSEQEVKHDYESDASGFHSTLHPIRSEDTSLGNPDKPLIPKMGPQDVNVLEENEYLVELCRKYKSRCQDKQALKEEILAWVHGKGGNFVVQMKGAFTVAPFSTVDGFLQRIVDGATQKKTMVVPSPLKSKGRTKNTSPRPMASLPTKANGKPKQPSVPEGSIVPNDVDVLLGRGNHTAYREGNLNFRKYCWALREEYKNIPRNEKRHLAQAVVDRVHAEGGRFLEPSGDTFIVASEARALEKVCQALREKKWESRKSLLGPEYSGTPAQKERKHHIDKAIKSSKTNLAKAMAPKKAPTVVSSTWQQPTQLKSLEADAPQSMNEELEVGSRIEVYWPLDQKYYAATVKAAHGVYVHIEYELDGVLEWLNLSEHTFRTIS